MSDTRARACVEAPFTLEQADSPTEIKREQYIPDKGWRKIDQEGSTSRDKMRRLAQRLAEGE